MKTPPTGAAFCICVITSYSIHYTKLYDLTRPLNAATPIYAGEGYRDPPLEVETWCSVAQQGFRVSRLALGTRITSYNVCYTKLLRMSIRARRVSLLGRLWGVSSRSSRPAIPRTSSSSQSPWASTSRCTAW